MWRTAFNPGLSVNVWRKIAREDTVPKNHLKHENFHNIICNCLKSWFSRLILYSRHWCRIAYLHLQWVNSFNVAGHTISWLRVLVQTLALIAVLDPSLYQYVCPKMETFRNLADNLQTWCICNDFSRFFLTSRIQLNRINASSGIRSSRHQGISPPTISPPRNHLATKPPISRGKIAEVN